MRAPWQAPASCSVAAPQLAIEADHAGARKRPVPSKFAQLPAAVHRGLPVSPHRAVLVAVSHTCQSKRAAVDERPACRPLTACSQEAVRPTPSLGKQRLANVSPAVHTGIVFWAIVICNAASDQHVRLCPEFPAALAVPLSCWRAAVRA